MTRFVKKKHKNGEPPLALICAYISVTTICHSCWFSQGGSHILSVSFKKNKKSLHCEVSGQGTYFLPPMIDAESPTCKLFAGGDFSLVTMW